MSHNDVLAIGDIFVSAALLTECFACDLIVCRGQCCVEGSGGAPLEKEEVPILIKEYDNFAPFMTARGREAVREQGVALLDHDREWATPLVNGAECAYARFDDVGICRCAIEYAFLQEKTPFRKPISCWLYPIRVQKLSTGCALNYHRWHLCTPACVRGEREGIPLYRFLKEPIIAKFGADFYGELEGAAADL